MIFNKILIQENDWSDAWTRHIETYLAAPPRCGIWLRSKFDLMNTSVLECAGGSCRDSRYLHSNSISASGSDFDSKTLDYLEKRFPETNFMMYREDAFAMSFEDKSFDVVFHNGFWIYFSENSDIIKLLIEQARVTRKRVVILVHNKFNNNLVSMFLENSKNDNLYKIRFFVPEELVDICKKSGIIYKNITIKKFGGPFDRLYGICNRFPFLKPITYWLVPKLYRFQPWSMVERIALIVDLE